MFSITDQIAEGFKGLSPQVQKGLIAMGTLAAGIGPLLFGIGSVIKLLPVLKLGFATFAGPVGIAVAAISAGAVSSAWTTLKSFVVDTGMWASLKNLISSTMDFIKAAFTATVGYTKTVWTPILGFMSAVWEKIRPIVSLAFENIKTIVKVGFDVVAGLFNTASGVLSGIFKTLTGVLTLDWAKFTEGIKEIGVSLWIGLVDLFKNGANLVGGLFANFLEAVGADSLAGSLRSGLAQVSQGVDGMKQKLQGAAKAGKEVAQAVAAIPKVPGVAKPQLPAKADQTAGSTSTADKKKVAETKSLLELYRARLNELEEQIKDLNLRGLEVPKDVLKAWELYADWIKKAEESLQQLQKLDIPDLNRKPPVPNTQPPALPGLGAFKERAAGVAYNPTEQALNYKAAIDQIEQAYSGGAAEGAKERFNELLNKGVSFDEAVKRVVTSGQQLKESISSSLQGAAQAGLVGMGELIGGIIAGTSRLADIPKMIGAVFADLAKQMGKSLIAFGTAGIAAKAFVSNPVTAIAAGVVLTALGSALSASMQKSYTGAVAAFANGGLVYGPTLGLVGEGRGTSLRNPEVIAPLDKLQSYMGGGRSVEVTGQFQLRGSDLLASVRRAEYTDRNL